MAVAATSAVLGAGGLTTKDGPGLTRITTFDLVGVADAEKPVGCGWKTRTGATAAKAAWGGFAGAEGSLKYGVVEYKVPTDVLAS